MTLEQPDWLVARMRRPRLRGVLHQYAFFVSLVLGALLVLGAQGGVERFSALVFAASVAAMLGRARSTTGRGLAARSAPLDARARPRGDLPADRRDVHAVRAGRARRRVARRRARDRVVGRARGDRAQGRVDRRARAGSPRSSRSASAGSGVFAFRDLRSVGLSPLALLAVGGLLYTAGAVIYALRRPDPLPSVFGYHELFHALVVAAAACQYVAVALFVL